MWKGKWVKIPKFCRCYMTITHHCWFFSTYTTYEFQKNVHPSMPFCIISAMSFMASASIMCLPETGAEDLANSLEEGEDFGRGQSFVQVLYIERRRQINTQDHQFEMHQGSKMNK